MDALLVLLQDRFVIGLLAGLLVALVVGFSSRRRRRDLLEGLASDSEVKAAGTRKTFEELERLKKENTNLRITIGTLKNKPNRAELRNLYVYDKAVRLCNSRIPGFGAHWEATWNEAELEMTQVDEGLQTWPRRIWNSVLQARRLPALPSGNLIVQNHEATKDQLKD